MSSSQGTSSYFRTREPEIADIKRIFPVSRRFDRRRPCRQNDASRSWRGRESRLEGRRGWSDGSRWSVIGRSRSLLVLLAVSCQSLVAVDSSGQYEPTSVIQLSPCHALVNNSIIHLGHLHRSNNVTAR